MNNLIKLEFENFKKRMSEKENIIIENFKKESLIKYPNISSPIDVIKGNYDYKVIFYINDIRVTSNFNFREESKFKLNFRFSLNTTEENIFKILNLDFNKLDNTIEIFLKAAKFYNVFEKFEKIKSPVISESSDDLYFNNFKYYRLYYNESFRQKKNITSVPNKSSYIESHFYMVYDIESNKIIEKINVKLPFLYKTKINKTFNLNEELDSDFLLEDFQKTYKSLTVNHINNVLKLKLKSNLITDEELFSHVKLLSLLKY